MCSRCSYRADVAGSLSPSVDRIRVQALLPQSLCVAARRCEPVLTLRFHSPSELTLGPSRSFIVEGSAIRQAPHNEIVCERRDRLWHLEDEGAPSFECTD